MELVFELILPIFWDVALFWLELVDDSSKLSNPQLENDPDYFLRLFLLGVFGLTFLALVGCILVVLV